MELLYRFVPHARKLDSYEDEYKECVCIILKQDTFTTLVEFEDGCKIGVPSVELLELKFGNKNIYVY